MAKESYASFSGTAKYFKNWIFFWITTHTGAKEIHIDGYTIESHLFLYFIDKNVRESTFSGAP